VGPCRLPRSYLPRNDVPLVLNLCITALERGNEIKSHNSKVSDDSKPKTLDTGLRRHDELYIAALVCKSKVILIQPQTLTTASKTVQVGRLNNH